MAGDRTDLLPQIHARLTQLEKTGETARLNEELKRRTIARVNRPEPVAGVGLASARAAGASIRRSPSSATLPTTRAGSSLPQARGSILSIPCAAARTPRFLDGDDPGAARLGHVPLRQLKAKLILAAGRAARADEGPAAALLLRPGRHARETLWHPRGARNRRAAGPRAHHHRAARAFKERAPS
jgi:hypothetical protein